MIFLLSFFWYLRTARALLFALYLWQLKEYHIGRFLAHFHTAKGKRLFFHPFVTAKLALFALWFFEPEIAFFLLLLLYLGETVLLFRATKTKTLLLPVLTRKTIVLVFSLLLVQSVVLAAVLLYFLNSLFLTFLLFDLLSLAIGSLVVLAWQPYTIFERSRILKRATEKRKRLKNLKVVGITGSYGKTSTKELLAHILAKKFVVLKTPEHRNSEMGIAHTILYDLTDEHQVFVCEMGAYNRGGIKLLASIAKPQIGIITGINEQHMATFGSQENIIKTKFELVEALPEDGTVILNEDSERVQNEKGNMKNYNTKLKKTIWTSSKQVDWKMGMPQHVKENVALAAGAAKELGMTQQEITEACKGLSLVQGINKAKRGVNGITVIDSSYSANPDGVIADLEYLKSFSGKKIIVIPSLIELGSASWQVHVKIGRKIGEVCDLAIITTTDEFSALQKGAKEKGMKDDAIILLESKEKIVEKVKSTTKAGDVVLLEGRGPAKAVDL